MNPEIKNLIRKIQRQAQGKHDEIEPATAIRLEGDRFTFKGQAIRVTNVSQLCSMAGIPVRTFEKLSSEQRAASFNELYEKLGDKHLMYRFNNDSLYGIVSPNYTRIDNSVMIDVLRRASSTLKLVPVKAIINSEFSFIRLIPEGVTPKIHELVPALAISNSEIGLSAFNIKASIYRTICSNGLIVEENQKKWRWLHYGAHVEVKPDLQEIMYVSNQFVRFLDNTKGRYMTIEEKIRFSDMVKKSLGTKVCIAFTDVANADYAGGRDWFSTINALTQTAQLFPAFKAVEIEEYAGRLLAA